MNWDGDSWEAHDPNSLCPPLSKPTPGPDVDELTDFQNHFVIKRKPSLSERPDLTHQNSESNVEVVWECRKLINGPVPKDRRRKPSSTKQETNTPPAGDGQIDLTKNSEELINVAAASSNYKSDFPPPDDSNLSKTTSTLTSDHVLPEYKGKSKVASLIAKFNQAAIADCNKKNNISSAVGNLPRFSGSGSFRRQDGGDVSISEQRTNAQTTACTEEENKEKLSFDVDNSQKSPLILDDVLLKYFPKDKTTKTSDATNLHHSSLADSLVASTRPHVTLNEPKHHNRKHERRRDHKRDKSTCIPPVSADLNKPFSPFRFDKQVPKDTTCTSNLIFGKPSKPPIFGLLVSPYIDMSSFKRPQLSSPLSGLASMGSTASSPMDKNYLKIKKHVETDKLKLCRMEDMDISLGASENHVLGICEQKTPIPIKCIFDEMQRVQKVGEGVFGEVYLGQFKGQGRVYKVVPIEGEERVNGEKQKSFGEIFPEILISKQLSKLSSDAYGGNFTEGYIKLHNTRLAIGVYPEILLNTWKTWDERHTSDNDCPSDFSRKQLYLIFEFDYGGKDAEAFVFKNSRQAFYLVLQIAHALAVGESAMEFEHRDLHWGNILVNDTDSANISFKVDGKTLLVPSGGIKGCIIDFTIARVVNEQQSPVFLDLKDDEEQFLGTGDHQFDIYRMMRDCNRNEWAPFCPKTNTYWIHYLADKLVSKARYLETDSLEHIYFIKQLQIIKSVIMRYDSCKQFIFHKACEDFKLLTPPRNTNLRSGVAMKMKTQKRKGVAGPRTRAQS